MGMSEKASEVFERGKYGEVNGITVKTSNSSKPPVDLFIVTPLTQGTYPVLLFCHGFMLQNTAYTYLLNFIASHGYILVAPQFYGFPSCSIPEEVKRAGRVTEWLSTGLPLVLPEKVAGDTENIALSGHSRGGKVAFALALGDPNYKFKALIGVDPVAGSSPSNRQDPKILEYIPRCFNISVPVAVIGTGYGSQSKWMFPPFAPDGVNHSEFFNESKPPVAYFLAKEYGHVDMMDDTFWVRLTKWIAMSGKGSMEDMKRAVGGIMVAFLRAYLEKKEDDLDAIVDDPSIAPILVDPVIYVKN